MSKNPEAKITVKMFNDDFKKGADELKKATQDTNREFKLQSEQMKLTASDTEKLEAKVSFLTKKHDLAKKSVQDHEKAYEQAKEMFGENSEAAQDMAKKLDNARIEEQKLANEIELANRALKAQKSEADEATSKLDKLGNKLKNTGDKMKNIGDGMKNVGKDLSLKVSAPIAAAGGAMFKLAADQETAFAKVSTLLQGSSEDYEQYKQDIRAASSEMGISFEDYAESVYSSISAGQEQGDAIEFTANAVKLAKGGFTDTSKAVDVMTTALNAYGLESKEATSISDMLITTQNLGKTTVDELSSSMGAVIPVAQAQGVSFDQLATGYAVLTKNGIATSEAGTYMKSMFGELGKSGSKVDKILRSKTGKSFSELQASGKNTGDVLAILQGEADKSGLKLSDMFGSVEAGSAALVLAKDDGAEFQDFLGQMEKSVGATDKAFNKMNETAGVQMQKAWITIKNVLAELGDVMLPIAANIAEKVGELVTKFSGLSPVMKNFVLIVGGIAAAIGPVIWVLGTLISSIGSIALGVTKVLPFLAKLKPMFTIIRVAMTALTGPIGIVIAIVTVLAIVIYKNWDAIKAYTISAFGAVKTILSKTWTWIKTTTVSVFNGIVNFFKVWGPRILIILGGPIAILVALIVKNWSKIKAVTTTAFNAVKNFLSKVWSNIKTTVVRLITGLVTGVKNKYNSLKSSTTVIFNAIKSAIMRPITAAKNTSVRLFNGLRSGAVTAFNNLRSNAARIFNAVKSAITNPISTAKRTIVRIIDSIKSAFSRLKIKIPKPKLPKISISTGSKKIAGVSIPYPKFDVSWFKTGGVFTKPVVAGNAGFGDVQEAIVPFEGPHAARIAKLIAEQQGKLANAATHLLPPQQVLQIDAGDVIVDGRSVGNVIWKHVKEKMDMADKQSRLFGKGG